MTTQTRTPGRSRIPASARALAARLLSVAALGICAAILALPRPQASAEAAGGVAERAGTALNHAALQSADEAFAEPLPADRGAAGLLQSLRRLHTRASLIMINAHPDDEDGGMLTFESRGEGAEVSLLSLTRGEGGQNVMTGDFWDRLGVLRTQELLAASRYTGAHLYFTRAADFGFSKTLDEALRQWGHDRLLADAVRVVRMTRPMVVTSVFAGNVSDGHGQHQASGVMAQEVFEAAGDPARFPEQIREGLRPWKPLKVYARVPFARVTEKGIYDYATGHWEPVRFRNYATGGSVDGVPTATVTIHEGTFDPVLGRSYLQMAREGLNQQKSQNGGIPIPPAGRYDSSYHLYASRVGVPAAGEEEASFFAGIDTSLAGMATYVPGADQAKLKERLQAISAAVDEAQREFRAEQTTRSAPALARGLRLTEALQAEVERGGFGLAGAAEEDARANLLHELGIKRRQFNTALAQSLGLEMRAVVQATGTGPARPGPFGPADAAASSADANLPAYAVPGQALPVSVHLANQGALPLQLRGVRLLSTVGALAEGGSAASPTSVGPRGFAAGESADLSLSATVAADAPLTRPYFSRASVEESTYTLREPAYAGRPQSPYPVEVEAAYEFEGAHAELRGAVQTAHYAPGQGVVLWPLEIAPAVSLAVTPASGILPLHGDGQLNLRVSVTSLAAGVAKGEVQLELPPGWTSEPAVRPYSIAERDGTATVEFNVRAKNMQAGGGESGAYRVHAVAVQDGHRYTLMRSSIGYPGVLPYPYLQTAESRLEAVDAAVAPGVRVGYVAGTGDDLSQAIAAMGVPVTTLSPEDLKRGELSQYSAIVLGIRTYAKREDLRAANDRLLAYVKAGGVVICNYQSAGYDSALPPYPIAVPGDAEKVVEEDAKVTLLRPDDPVLQWPNRIGAQDFEGWVEERGHGFPRSFDSHYVALTEVHDAGQSPQTGGIIYAPYGRGYYVYLAYAFFRQMPEGVPGSYRIMANLLSMGKNEGLGK